MAETTSAKPGVATTEHVFSWILGLVVGGTGLQDGDPTVRAAALIALGLIGAGYSLSRGKAKGGPA